MFEELEKEDLLKILYQLNDIFGDDFRICSECGNVMQEGYCIDNGTEYYCSDECLHKIYTQEEYDKMYDEGYGDSFWTTWY